MDDFIHAAQLNLRPTITALFGYFFIWVVTNDRSSFLDFWAEQKCRPDFPLSESRELLSTVLHPDDLRMNAGDGFP